MDQAASAPPAKALSPPRKEQEATPEAQAPPKTVATTPMDTKTGRRMRDCRKFIHYEFSPPFVSSESSQSEVETVEGETLGIKKMTKKRGRPRKTLSMEEKARDNSPVKEVALPSKKPGRKPIKSMSIDEALLQGQVSSEVKLKKKRGRPPKNRAEVEPSNLSVSQMAENLAESHVQSRSQIISQQRQSLLSRRSSEGSETAGVKPAPRHPALRQERSHSFDTVEGVDELTRRLMESHPQLLLKTPNNFQPRPDPVVSSHLLLANASFGAKQNSPPIKTADMSPTPDSPAPPTYHVSTQASSDSQATNGLSSPDFNSKTIIVRKKVTVQRCSEPLMNIVDHMPKKNSPPPQAPEDENRPTTPPPGTCTIFQENLDLLDGMRVLTKIGPHFYPGKVTAVEGSSIFAVSVEGERGNKPHIYPAEELLQKTLLDVKPNSRRYTPVGARVCVLWSPKLNFLYPGTVKSFPSLKQFIFVELDDGDEREIHIDNVRLLPKTYPKVVSKTKRESPLGEVEDDTMIRLSIAAISPDAKKRLPGKPGQLQGQHKFHEKPTHLPIDDAKPKLEIKDATLKADLLKDGLRILNKKNGHFYPGRLNTVRPPDIYGILLDNERGFRPNIYAREELLEDAIREIKVKSADLPMGTRVCAYWSAKYHFLHPGTVIPVSEGLDKNPGKYLNVELDDGDSREVHIDQLRLLPPGYPRLIYSDPLESPKKRSRPSTPRDGAKSDQSRPSSALSDHSDVGAHSPARPECVRKPTISFEASRAEVLNDLAGLSPPPPLLSPKELEPKIAKKPFKVFIPEAPVRPATTDLVGLISRGIDKLVDKKVMGNRNNFSPVFYPPPSQCQPLPPPTLISPQLPLTSPSPLSPTNEPMHQAPPTLETGAKAKSRLSSLIQAMSGKMKKPEGPTEEFSPLPPMPAPPPSPTTMQPSQPVVVNKWMTAFNVKPLVSPSKERPAQPPVPLHPAQFLSALPKTQETREVETKSNEENLKFRHKHNILLGYDFVDENDSDIMAWDKAVNRRKKTEKPKLFRESDIKEEIEDKEITTTQEEISAPSENSIHKDVTSTMNTILASVTDEEKMRLSLLSAALKKYSPIKMPGNKSPKSVEEKEKKKKKKYAKRISLSSDDENSRSGKESPKLEIEEPSLLRVLSGNHPSMEMAQTSTEEGKAPTVDSPAADSKETSHENSPDNFDDLLAICEESNIGVEATKQKEAPLNNAPVYAPVASSSRRGSAEELRQEQELIFSQLSKFRAKEKVKTAKQDTECLKNNKLVNGYTDKSDNDLKSVEESKDLVKESSQNILENTNNELPEIKLTKVNDTATENEPEKRGQIKNGFMYRDSILPEGWCIMMKRRENGKMDSYFITPCQKRLRSKPEVVKYLGQGEMLLSKTGKKDHVMSLEEMPLRSELSKEDFDSTKDLDGSLFMQPEKKLAEEENLSLEPEITTTVQNHVQENSVDIQRADITEETTKLETAKPLVELKKDNEHEIEELDENKKDEEELPTLVETSMKKEDSNVVNHVDKTPSRKKCKMGMKGSPRKLLGINKTKTSFNLITKRKILKSNNRKIQNEKKRKLLRNKIGRGEKFVKSEPMTQGNDEKEHIFKVPSLERFQLQKRKSAKLSSPTREELGEEKSMDEGHSVKLDEIENDKDDIFLNGFTITKTVAVSVKRFKNPFTVDQVNGEVSDTDFIEKDEEESNKENKNSPETMDEQVQTRRTRNHVKADRPCPKSQKSKPVKRKTRSSESEQELTSSPKEDEEEVKAGKKPRTSQLNEKEMEDKSEKDLKESNSAVEPEPKVKSAKQSPGNEIDAKDPEPVNDMNYENAHEETINLNKEIEESSESNTQQSATEIPKSKSKLLGPRSRRKRTAVSSDEEKGDQDHETKNKAKEANLTMINEIECALTPPSPKKNAISQDHAEAAIEKEDQEEEEPGVDEGSGFSPVPSSTYDFLLKMKHLRCNVKLVSLFQSSVCRAACAHCPQDAHTLHTVELDLPNQVVYLECQGCHWTTVRRATMATVTVS